MHTNSRPRRMLALDGRVECSLVSAPLITAISREQMPEDMRSAFLPEDIILLCEPSHNSSIADQTLAQARRNLSLLTRKCPWCMADSICARLIVTLAVLFSLGAASFQNKMFTLENAIAASSAMLTLLTLIFAYIHLGTGVDSGANLFCSQGVKFHYIYNLAGRMFSPSLLFLLQQPMLNVRSFFRYYHFFIINGQAGGPADKDVDICIRHHAAEGALSRVGLIEDGSHILLALASCQDIVAVFGWEFPRLNGLYRTYRDWKRWRLAALVSDRLLSRDGIVLQQGDTSDHRYVNLLERLGDGGGYKWFLVDSRLFSQRTPS
ncbi:hypothetical protein VSDG_08821 [Cytospora chrysosperma]|uniref:Uncharacterized protein n=1 Tax=Cytospora chrysosperma TaxID=252740 RepID=A0A423VGW9_CYTCH|nr:hypothetical protein VSDG_08821 [Valsa sordida]